MQPDKFASRHIGPNEDEISKMLSALEVDSIEELLSQTLPEEIRLKRPLALREGISEYRFLSELRALSDENQLFETYIGMGYHPTITPAVIQRNILENPGWYTAYTPYQAEIAQGRLEALFNFQSMICELTGMELANASLLDEATAVAEAMTMCYAVRSTEQKKAGANKLFVSQDILPQSWAVLNTRAIPLGIELVRGDITTIDFDTSFFGAFLQYPGKHGNIMDLSFGVSKAKAFDLKTIVAADLLSLTILEAPGTYSVDVVVGTTQRFGIPLGYGGPHAAYFATKEEFKRNLPGRIIGVSIDQNGNRALRMALQTREQHIKRDRATSNICTAQVLLAVMAGMYGVYHGPDGLREIANKIHSNACILEENLNLLGFKTTNKSFFDTVLVECDSKLIKGKALENEINFHYPSDNKVSISINETTSINDIYDIVSIFAKSKNIKLENFSNFESLNRIPKKYRRESDFMADEVFSKYKSETSLMRYIKSLEKKDLALNTSMISLGSCTMKLNAAAEMLPLSWNRWLNIHPFAPKNQAIGYEKVLKKLESQLKEITGFDAVSLQPNSGAQGEYAGLMVIKSYHENNGDFDRKICLIPSSAHGTNPASAVMAGMEVVVVNSSENGNIDISDLEQKAIEHKSRLGALMITYPSTHGVFESDILRITEIIHSNGGQVYMDGANMNAQVGLTNPKIIGADVCHLNLHKTFAIPHGGGGPGVGPICVAKHLSPFLPSNPLIKTGGEKAIPAISGAPFGSALACLISYGYISMLGASGLTKATEIAILNANYIKERLNGHYEILYTGELGRSAHEMIIDCRPFKEYGIEVVDIAKRLMDYGFHAPTVSFPVAGTMMIEPTESENKEEIDRFCDAMISIKGEIVLCKAEDESNLLKNSPHTLEMVTSNDWDYKYSREKAAFALTYIKENKFWPTVRRVNDAHGDRNLICSCTPIELYAD